MKRFVNSMQRGFTLIELMVVLVIVTILLSIAIPAYEDQMRRSRRADAINGLESMVLRQEQWRANNPRYGTLAEIGNAPTSQYYDFTVEENTAANFRVRAVAKGAQSSDSGCTTLEINRARTKSPASCFQK